MKIETTKKINKTNRKDYNMPKYYIACLGSYNNGILSGKWFDWATSDTQYWEQVKEVLDNSQYENAEETAIHDYDGGVNLGEYPDVDRLTEVGCAMDESSEEIVKAYLENQGEDADLQCINDKYVGNYDTEKDFAMSWATDCLGYEENPTWPMSNIDWDGATRDLMFDFWTAPKQDGTINVFYNN